VDCRKPSFRATEAGLRIWQQKGVEAGMKYYHAETVMALWNMQTAIDKALAQSP